MQTHKFRSCSVQLCNKLPLDALGIFPFIPSTFRKRFFLFFISNLIHRFFVYVQYLLSSFLYMFQDSQAHHQEVQIVHAAYGILPLCRCLCCAAVGKELSFVPFFLNSRTTKTPAEGENTIGCMYNLDLLMGQFFLNGRTTKTSAEGENTIGCMYNLDLLMGHFFLNGRTTKTSAEGENTIGCMYILDLLMMGP